jgi:RecB family exonuclease
MKFKIKAAKWTKPKTKPDRRTAVLAVPGLVIDTLFEMWLYRREFTNGDWLKDNYDMVWDMTVAKRRPKWSRPEEADRVRKQTFESIRILYQLLHKHDLLNEEMGIQTAFHELIADQIAIAGAMDLWTLRKDGTLVLVDFKNFCSPRPRSTDQLHFYAMALKQILGCEPDEAAYLGFHPDSPGYRHRKLRHCDRQKLLARMERATEARACGEFKAKYNGYSCPRFCEVRFGCPEFLKRCPHLRGERV